MIVDAHVHLLPERLAAKIRRFFEDRGAPRMPYPYAPEAARRHLVEAGITRCWSLPYAHRAGVAGPLNRWMAETWGADSRVLPGATVHPDDDVDFGSPAVGRTLSLLRERPNLYADLCPVVGDPVRLSRESIAGLERRILFGSDTPTVAVTIEDSIARVRSWHLDSGDEEAILGGTANGLLGLPG